MTRIDEIRERLDAISKEPWHVIDDQEQVDPITGQWQGGYARYGANVVAEGYIIAKCDIRSDEQCKADAVFIACAPEDIRYLLGEIARLQASKV